MPDTIKCDKCKGARTIEVLISMHDDKTEIITCPKCKGKGIIHQMTESEERDYWENYW